MGIYKQEFIKKVKSVYKNCPNIISAAEEGKQFLGRYLDDNCQDTISPNDLETLSPNELKKKGLDIKKRKLLYHMWCTGEAFTKIGLETYFCPLSFAQSANYKEKELVEKVICKERKSGYVFCFSSCKNWETRYECWKLYRKNK